MESKVLLVLSSTTQEQKFLFEDAGGIALRSMWIQKSGQAKSVTIPLTREEVGKMAEWLEQEGTRNGLPSLREILRDNRRGRK